MQYNILKCQMLLLSHVVVCSTSFLLFIKSWFVPISRCNKKNWLRSTFNMPTFVNIILCNSQWRDITILLRYCNDALTCHAAFIVLQMSNLFSYLSFTSKSTTWGQFITSVCNMTASTDDRQYWQLLDSNNKPLDKGMNMYTRKVLSVYLNKF